ncbi:MAG: hypothetical protein WCH34_08665 [Bacteroidota bacterium]
MRKILLFFAFAFFLQNAYSQCCSGGNSFGGTTNVGIVDKANLRVTAFFRHSYSEDYYKGDKINDIGSLQNAYFNYTGAILAYGITRRLTAEVELGYFINKTQIYRSLPDNPIIGSGIANSVVSVKYNFFNNLTANIEYTGGVGVKFPSPLDPKYVGGYSIDIQPSTGAYGFVAHSFLSKKFPEINFRMILVNRFEYNMANDKDYQFGNTLFSSLFLTEKLATNLMGILQIRHEYRSNDTKPNKLKDVNTGGNIFIVSPQANYTVYKGWSVGGAVDVPVYRNYNGKQFANLCSFNLSISKQFSLRK